MFDTAHFIFISNYSLSFLVTLFSSAPVTRRLSREHLQRIDQIRQVADDILRRRVEGGGFSTLSTTGSLRERRQEEAKKEVTTRRYQEVEERQHQEKPTKLDKVTLKKLEEARKYKAIPSNSFPFPFAFKTLALDADTRFPTLPLKSSYQKVARVVRR